MLSFAWQCTKIQILIGVRNPQMDFFIQIEAEGRLLLGTHIEQN